jgi:hypothetical protein
MVNNYEYTYKDGVATMTMTFKDGGTITYEYRPE